MRGGQLDVWFAPIYNKWEQLPVLPNQVAFFFCRAARTASNRLLRACRLTENQQTHAKRRTSTFKLTATFSSASICSLSSSSIRLMISSLSS